MSVLSEWNPMATEIERKFLVPPGAWRPKPGSGTPYRQGYLSSDPERIVRVRIAGDAAFAEWVEARGATLEAYLDEAATRPR